MRKCACERKREENMRATKIRCECFVQIEGHERDDDARNTRIAALFVSMRCVCVCVFEWLLRARVSVWSPRTSFFACLRDCGFEREF